MGLLDWFSSAGRWINGAFNTVKNWTRGASSTIRNVTRAVGSGARAFSWLPGIGGVLGAVGNVADGVEKGLDLAETVFSAGDMVQRAAGLQT